MFFMFLKYVSNFKPIEYFLFIILDYKNSKFKHLVDDTYIYIAINLWSYWNFVSIEDIKRKCNIMMDLSKFTSNKKKY